MQCGLAPSDHRIEIRWNDRAPGWGTVLQVEILALT